MNHVGVLYTLEFHREKSGIERVKDITALQASNDYFIQGRK